MSDFVAGLVFGFGVSCVVLGGVVLHFMLRLQWARKTYESFMSAARNGDLVTSGGDDE